MRIALMPFGSRGDYQPLVPLDAALRARGHEVQMLVIGDSLASWLRAAGVSVRVVQGIPDMDEVIKTNPALSEAMRTGNFKDFNRGRLEAMQRIGEPLIAALVDFAQDFKPDVAVVHAMLNPFGCYLRELGTPVVKLYLQPGLPTQEHAPIFFAMLPKLCAAVVALGLALRTHKLQAQMAQSFFLAPSGPFQRTRRDAALPPLTLARLWRFISAPEVPALCAYSPLLAPPPADYAAAWRVGGFCTLPVDAQLDNFAPDAALRAFLAAGAPPVYMGWGSMIAGGKEHMAALAVGAAAAAGVRAVVLGGWARIGADALPAGPLRAYAAEHVLFCAAALPHEWLLPQCACAVIHGGAGTTAAVLRSGVPAVVTPVFVDQFYWAQRVHALGVGVGFGTTPLLEISAAQLGAAVRRCLDSAELRRGAAALGEQLRAEDGVGAAVAVVEAAAAAPPGRWDSAPAAPPPAPWPWWGPPAAVALVAAAAVVRTRARL